MTTSGRSYGWSVERRLGRHVSIEGDCWIWQGATTRNGYGMVQVDGRRWMAHRYAYTALVGPVQPQLDLDHLCRRRACVNPDHLEPVTRSENLRRGMPRGEHLRARTECPRGHPYDERNTAVRNGHRICRACDRDRARRNREVRRGAN